MVASVPVDLPFEAGEIGTLRDPDPEHLRLAPGREVTEALENELERPALDQRQRLGHLFQATVVELADETKRQVLLLRAQPAHVAGAAGERLERAFDRIRAATGRRTDAAWRSLERTRLSIEPLGGLAKPRALPYLRGAGADRPTLQPDWTLAAAARPTRGAFEYAWAWVGQQRRVHPRGRRGGPSGPLAAADQAIWRLSDRRRARDRGRHRGRRRLADLAAKSAPRGGRPVRRRRAAAAPGPSGRGGQGVPGAGQGRGQRLRHHRPAAGCRGPGQGGRGQRARSRPSAACPKTNRRRPNTGSWAIFWRSSGISMAPTRRP